MKTKTLVSILILVLVVLIIAGSCATGKKMITVDDAIKQFEGVYVNTEYSGVKATHPQKFVITSDGRLEYWSIATHDIPMFRWQYTVVESWVDSKGSLYCIVDKSAGYEKTKELWKLDKSGNTLEVNFRFGSGGDYPTKIDPIPDPYAFRPIYYCIWYRQE